MDVEQSEQHRNQHHQIQALAAHPGSDTTKNFSYHVRCYTSVHKIHLALRCTLSMYSYVHDLVRWMLQHEMGKI